MNKPIGIHWFRYDLRLKNNPSLSNLSKKVDKVKWNSVNGKK